MANYYNKINYSFMSDKDGKVLEDAVAFSFRKGIATGFVDTTGTNKDFYDGTDFEIYGVPGDITCNPNKSNTHWIETSQITVPFNGFDAEVCFGIRTGNGRVEFKVPVLVFLVRGDMRNISNHVDNFASALIEKMDDIIDCGQDIYWNFIDSHPQYEAALVA